MRRSSSGRAPVQNCSSAYMSWYHCVGSRRSGRLAPANPIKYRKSVSGTHHACASYYDAERRTRMLNTWLLWDPPIPYADLPRFLKRRVVGVIWSSMGLSAFALLFSSRNEPSSLHDGQAAEAYTNQAMIEEQRKEIIRRYIRGLNISWAYLSVFNCYPVRRKFGRHIM